MEPQLLFSTEGQAVTLDDLSQIAEQAALADDRLLHSLFQFPSFQTGNGGKYVMPLDAPGFSGKSGEALVRPSGQNNASTIVEPMRVLLGPRGNITADVTWKDARSVVFAYPEASAFGVQHAATVSNNRWDLIYVQLIRDAALPSAIRAVKGLTGGVTGKNISTSVACQASLLLQNGAENTTPALPAVPADTLSGIVNIPLAYVRLTHPHLLSTPITSRQIIEVAPRWPISSRTGAVTLQPASQSNATGGSILGSGTAGIGVSGVVRPPAFLPDGMMGMDGRFFALGFNGSGTGRSIPLNGITVLDDSIDWRYRVFWSDFHFNGTTFTGFSWDLSGGRAPSPDIGGGGGVVAQTVGRYNTSQMGNSFQADSHWAAATGSGGLGIANAGPVAFIDHTQLSEVLTGATLAFFVDMTDGKLKVSVGATDPTGFLFARIMASGQNPNRGF